MRFLNKGADTFNIGETLSDDGGDPKQSNYMFTRSVFLRMVSMLTSDGKPIILSGGEEVDNTLQHGMDIYGPRNGPEDDKNINKRPLAGIKDVNVEYAGGGMKIGATRKTSISWTCWSWEELQKFKPFFLKHGRAVLIEFGWGFDGPDKPQMLPITNSDGTLNVDLINGTGTNSKTLQEYLPDFIIEQKGHYDAVLGTISNFEFSVNETGGFDCTTELVSLGVNTLNKMREPESMKGRLSELPIAAPEEGFWWWSKDKAILGAQINDKNPYYNFVAYMKSFEGHLHLNAINSKGTIAYLLGNDEPYCTWGWFEDNVLSRFVGQIESKKSKIVTEFRSLETQYDNDGNPLDEPKPVQVNASKDIIAIDYSPKGWFFAQGGDDPEANEKNEENSVLIPGMKVYTKYEQGFDYNWKQWFASLLTIDAEMGDFKMMFGPPYVQESNKGTGKWIGSGWKDGKPWEKTWKKTFLGNEDAKWKYEGSYFRKWLNEDGDKGTIRNVYFGHEFLTECFVGASTIADGVEAVWNKFSNAYGGIYDFGIHFDDKEGRLMIKDQGFTQKRVEKVLENKSTNRGYDLEGKETQPGLFVFPVWEKNSLVISQNLNAKLPSRMQIAALYGNNQLEFGDGEINGHKDWGAMALGKAEMATDRKDQQDRMLQDILMGEVDHPFKRHSHPHDNSEATQHKPFTFGNASADNNKPLQWKIGPTPDTTTIYEDLGSNSLSWTDIAGQTAIIGAAGLVSGGAGGVAAAAIIANSNYEYLTSGLNTENDEYGWGRGINEILNDQLTQEYTERLKRAYGKIDTTGMTEEEAEEAKKEFDDKIADDLAKAEEEAKEKGKNFRKAGEGYLEVFMVDEVQRQESYARYQDEYYPKVKAEYRGIMQQILLNDNGGVLKVTDPLIPIDFEIEIDGTGGIFPGNSFHSSYLPKSYMDKMCFQAIGASHKIDSTGWTTTIKGQMRVAGYPKRKTNNMDYKYDTEVPTYNTFQPQGEYQIPFGDPQPEDDDSEPATTLNMDPMKLKPIGGYTPITTTAVDNTGIQATTNIDDPAIQNQFNEVDDDSYDRGGTQFLGNINNVNLDDPDNYHIRGTQDVNNFYQVLPMREEDSGNQQFDLLGMRRGPDGRDHLINSDEVVRDRLKEMGFGGPYPWD